jgi:NADH dehydrogenase
MVQRILVLGGGFAGVGSAAGAARKLNEAGVGSDQVSVTLINRDPWHCIRVRNYEADLRDVRVRLDDVLIPIGVTRIEADVRQINVQAGHVVCAVRENKITVPFDRLIIALGSQLVRPPVPGLAEYGFDVDTYDAGERLNRHIAALATSGDRPGRFTAVVVGAGLTGFEVAAEMHGKLRAAIALSGQPATSRVVLVDRGPRIAGNLGENPRPVIAQALDAMEVEGRAGASVASVDRDGIMLTSNERIDTATMVWCGGLRASPLLETVPADRDALGRLFVEPTMKVRGLSNVFAAGDAACASMDDSHVSVMSCQHARPMGRFAGYNAAADILRETLLDLRIPNYVTVLDLGPWGALHTEGWDRHVLSQGEAAKRTKQTINRLRIYPPGSGLRQDILAAAAPFVQAPPAR